MGLFTIDFFEFAFLVETCIPPMPIARTMFFDKVSDKHYHKMLPEERNTLFEWIKPKLDLENIDCRYFYDRFNPDNQFIVTVKYEGKKQKVDCFVHEGKFHTTKTQSIYEKFIIKQEKK